MADMSDQTVLGAWMIAIPSTLHALSTWYVRRKINKAGEAAKENTAEVVTAKSDETKAVIEELKVRFSQLETAVQAIQATSLAMSKTYTESLDRVQAQMGAANAIFQRVVSTKPDVPDPGKVTLKDDKTAPLGKVILKP